MEILTDYRKLVGKKIAFSHMAEFADQITLATEDGCLLMAKMAFCEDEEEEGKIKVLVPHAVMGVLEKHEWMRNELSKLGIFDMEQYNEEQRIKREKKQEEFRQKQLEKERAEYERLKAKFEHN